MKLTTKENGKSVIGYVKYLKVILGLTIILIGNLFFYHFVFNNPSILNEQGIFLYSMFSTLIIASGIWLISSRNKSVPGDLSKSQFYRSLIIMIGVILVLVSISFFFD